MRLCAGCGYRESDHVAERCPVCACGELATAHSPVAEPPSPLRAFAEKGKVVRHCPGKDTRLRHGTFRPAPSPAEPDPRCLPRRFADPVAPLACFPMRVEWEAEQERQPPAPPLRPTVPARAPRGPEEIAGYQGRQAVGLGRKAVAAGWAVNALYWRASDGTEGCGVWLSRAALRAVAIWNRPSEKAGTRSGWATAVAYGWRADVRDRPPTAITHTDLERLFT